MGGQRLWLVVLAIVCRGVAGAFGSKEDNIVGLSNQATADAKKIHDLDAELDDMTEDEKCCDKAKMAYKEALFAKFMNTLPPRKVHPNSVKPESLDTNLQLMCDFTNITKFHYIDADHRKTKRKNRFLDAFGDNERNDWGNAYIDEKHKVIFTPLIPKTGTTSFSKCFGDNKEYKLEKLEKFTKTRKMDFDQYTVVTAMRSPLDRFFSSHSQIEAFIFIGWFDPGSWENYWNIRYYDDYCPIGYWAQMGLGPRSGKKGLCQKRISSMAHRLRRVERYLDDVEMRGYFNWHNHPQSKFFNHAAQYGLSDKMNGFVDTRKLIDGLNVLRKKYKLRTCSNQKSMSSSTNSWAVKGRELLAMAKFSKKAEELTRRICMVYAVDFRCLPFAIPDACKDLQLDADKPNLPVPTGVDMDPENCKCCKAAAEARRKKEMEFTVPKQALDSFAQFTKKHAKLNYGGSKVCKMAGKKSIPTENAFFHFNSDAVKGYKYPDEVFDTTGALFVPPMERPAGVGAPKAGMRVYVQDPIERVLLAYSRLEGLFRMGSKDVEWATANVTYWKRHCQMSYEIADEYQWKKQGWAPWNVKLPSKLARFSNFVHDIENKGFFDPAVAPQSLLLRHSNQLGKSTEKLEFEVYKKDLTDYHPVSPGCKAEIEKFSRDKNKCNLPAGKAKCHATPCKDLIRDYFRRVFDCQWPMPCSVKKAESKCSELEVNHFCYNIGARKTPDAWTISSKELLDPPKEMVPAVARLLRRICMLYVVDYGCLPFTLPKRFFDASTADDPCKLKKTIT